MSNITSGFVFLGQAADAATEDFDEEKKEAVAVEAEAIVVFFWEKLFLAAAVVVVVDERLLVGMRRSLYVSGCWWVLILGHHGGTGWNLELMLKLNIQSFDPGFVF